MSEPKTMEVSAETYNKICGVSQQLAKILRKKHVSIDQTLKIFFICKPLDVMLEDMILEEGLDWKTLKKKPKLQNNSEDST